MFNFKTYRDRVSSSEDGDGEDAESLLEKQGQRQIEQQATTSRLCSLIWSITTHLLVFVAALWIAREYLGASKGVDMNQIQHWSSVSKDVDIKYTPQQFNGSFMHANVYRQDAGPEVDAAWEALGVNYRALAIPEEDAEKSGITPSHVRINPKYGGGYPANVEGLHQLHCLNLVRMSLQWNFDYYKAKGHGAFSNEMYILKLHVTHCLDIVRQQLMCTVDTGVLGQIWWGDVDNPEGFVDFNTNHQCKNYEAIRQWAEERQLPPPDECPGDFLLPPRGPEDILPAIP